MKERARRSGRRRVFVLVLLAFLGLASLWKLDDMRSSGRMAEDLRHLESAGVLGSTESLVKSAAPASGSSYLPLLDEVGDRNQLKLPNINIAKYGRPWLRREFLESWYSANEEFRAKVAAAADAPALVWSRQVTSDPTIQLTENKHLGELGFVLMGEVCYLAMNGDFAGSLQALDRIDKMTVLSMQDPTETGFLEGLVLEDFYFRAATVLLEMSADDKSTLRALRERFSARPQWPPYKKALSGTLITTRLKLQHPRYAREHMVPFVPTKKATTSTVMSRDPLRFLWGSRAFRVSEERRFVSLVRRLVDELPEDIEDWEGRKQAVENFKTKRPHGMLGRTLLNPISLDFDWLASPVITSALVKRDLLVASADVLWSRAETGGLPRSLAGRHVDRFSGKGFLYEVTPEGFIVYSVSHDGKDNGGAYKVNYHNNDLPVIIHLGTAFW